MWAVQGKSQLISRASEMNPQAKPSPFSQMNKAMKPSDSAGYRSWKQKEQAPVKEKPLNPASFTEFPDLVKSAPKKSVFEGASLAAKLKEAIAAEEEEAIQKRLKKGTTPEMLLREMCVVLPLKKSTSAPPSDEFVAPSWVTEEYKPTILPRFRPRSHRQMMEEMRWKRLGINPNNLYLNDDLEEEEMEDAVSLPPEEGWEEPVETQEEICVE